MTYVDGMEQISVLPGDVIGVHYALVSIVPGSGVIPYAQSSYPLCCGLSKLSNVASSDAGDDTFTIGSIHSFKKNTFRTPALTAFIEY